MPPPPQFLISNKEIMEINGGHGQLDFRLLSTKVCRDLNFLPHLSLDTPRRYISIISGLH